MAENEMSQTPEPGRNADWQKVQELFLAALDRSEPEREAWLDAQAGVETWLRDEVKSLLRALQKHEDLSREPRPAGRAPIQPEERLVGELCGPYRLTRLIGTGGMAWVYEGSREGGEFEQRVAVKVLPAVFGAAMLARFRREKQILAGLSHPGIAHLLDGGTTAAGLSYLVMEYVEGERISSYVGKRGLSRDERIRLFLKVSEAVEFAHTRRVIHRDIKPANILVASSAEPKLLDFGIAQLLDADGAGQATQWRAHTPGYASPEQLRGEPAGVASDVYQLGVLLAEVLAGDRQPLPHLGADLEAVIAKARRSQPEERYSSVALLAEDLNRYLAGLPVRAGNGAAIRRAGKFAKRYRGRITATGLLILLLVSGAAILYQVRARSRERIQRAGAMYQAVLREGASIGEHVAGNKPELASEVWRRLRDSVEQLRRDDPDNPRVTELLAHCYLQLGQLAWYRYGPSLMDPEAGLQSYQHARRLFEEADSQHAPDANAFHLALSARMFGSEILIEKGRGFDAFAEVVQLLLAGEAKRRVDPDSITISFVSNHASFYDMLSDRLGANMSGPPGILEHVPQWYSALAGLHPYLGTDSLAAAIYQEALSSPASGETAEANTRALIRLQLGRLQHQAGLREQGVRTLKDCLSELQRELGSSPGNEYLLHRIAAVHSRLGNAAEVEGNFADALAEREIAIEILQRLNAGQQSLYYYMERLGEARIDDARVLTRLGRAADALRTGRLGIRLLDENAQRNRAAAFTLDLAAQRLLTVEPAGLRDASKALLYARQAVDRTAGQMPPYLATLAFAELAVGHEKEAGRAAAQAVQGYRRTAGILKPLFDSSRYPEASRLYRELQRRLDQLEWLK
jgi:serine/threonine protein kinase/tetratricopeptide (TPR) repeat protein